MRGSVLLPLARYADDDARRRVVAQAMNTLRSQPGIGGAAVVMPPPFRGLAPGALTVEGRPVAAGSEPRATHHTVTPTYFDVLGITLRGGRLFTGRDDATAVPAVIVSERLARQLWPDGGALGKRISLGDAQAEPVWRTVVGIVGDVRKTITGEQLPDTYVPYEQNPRAYVYVVARGAGEPAAVASRVRRALGSVDEVLALSDVQSLPESVARESARQRLLTTLLGGFSVFALVLRPSGSMGRWRT